MEWFRWYHGACSDAKWPLIARKAHTTVGVVVSVWVALLEYASQDDERGSVEGFDCETFDALYGYSDGTCEAVLSAMLEKGLIEDGCICSWSRRQPQREREESTNAERQRRYRERRRLERDGEGVTEEDGNVTDVTAHNVTGVTRNVTRNGVTPRNASVTPPEQNRGEQRREEENTHTPKYIFNYQNTRVRVDPPARVCEAVLPSGELLSPDGVEPQAEKISCLPERRPDGPVKTDAPSKGHPEWRAFLSCWDLWPVKQGQEDAWREWMRLHANGTLAPCYVIRESIARLQAEDSRWARGMIPRMAKWLHGKGWNDEPYMQPGQGSGAVPMSPGNTPRAPTEFQKRQQEARGMAAAALAARNSERQMIATEGGCHEKRRGHAVADIAPCRV